MKTTTLTRKKILSADLTTLRLLVAQHVMAHPLPLVRMPVVPDDPGYPLDWHDAHELLLPCYATQIEDAWLVWEKGGYVELHKDGANLRCEFNFPDTPDGGSAGGDVQSFPPGTHEAEALCRTALFAVLDRNERRKREQEG